MYFFCVCDVSLFTKTNLSESDFLFVLRSEAGTPDCINRLYMSDDLLVLDNIIASCVWILVGTLLGLYDVCFILQEKS